MSNRNLARDELTQLAQLEPLITARQEIAVMRIEKPRQRVLAGRTFFTDLFQVFNQVRSAYRQEVEHFWRQRRGSVIALFSTDMRLTGPIARATVSYFATQVEQQAADPIVIGLVGKEQFASRFPGMRFTYVPLSAQAGQLEKDITALVRQLIQYERITIVFSKYENLLYQYPTQLTLGDTATAEQATAERYIFEPSLKTIVSLFDRNLIALLLEQTTNENTVAHLGSQITAMEQADAAIVRRRRTLTLIAQQQTRQERNKKQRAALAGMQLWYT